MADINLVAEVGRPTGTSASRRLRRSESVPGVVYGRGVESTAVTVARRELRQALTGPAGLNAVINLKVGKATHPTVVKQMQRHPVRRNVIHVDFLVVDLDVEIEVEIPIVLHGEAKAVLNELGLVDPALNSLLVRCTPRAIPNDITIDITDMKIGDVIRVSDLEMPPGVTCPLDPDTPVVTAVATRAIVEEVPEVEAVEGETPEGDEAPGEQTEA